MMSDVVTNILHEGLFLVVMIASLLIVPSLVVGLIVSIFQAATQINEQTLSFLPRLLMTLIAILLGGPWIADRMVEFANGIITNMPFLIS